MNGNLTAYFHRRELDKYANVFHTIEGLDKYFPGLGNHDYEHTLGASCGGGE